MTHFITELRKAHLIFTAHQRGNRSMASLCSATHLSFSDVAYWVSAFHLSLTGPNNHRKQLPFESSVTFASANALEA